MFPEVLFLLFPVASHISNPSPSVLWNQTLALFSLPYHLVTNAVNRLFISRGLLLQCCDLISCNPHGQEDWNEKFITSKSQKRTWVLFKSVPSSVTFRWNSCQWGLFDIGTLLCLETLLWAHSESALKYFKYHCPCVMGNVVVLVYWELDVYQQCSPNSPNSNSISPAWVQMQSWFHCCFLYEAFPGSPHAMLLLFRVVFN